MIKATIPLERVNCTLEGKDYELPATVYFDRCSIQIAFGELVSFEFVLIGGELKMVKRQSVDGKMAALVSLVASGIE
jgi:hypothetical protein